MSDAAPRFDLDAVRFDERGLVPVVAQDAATRRVLMLAWANREALATSLATGRMTYWSRSRGALWTKGETSGATQRVVELRLDCDGDAVLARVHAHGAACHTGASSCWETAAPLPPDGAGAVADLAAVIAERRASPREGSYTNKLLADRNLARKKVAEEATEVVMASAANDRSNLVHEAADVLYHLLALLAAHDVPLDDVAAELARRRR